MKEQELESRINGVVSRCGNTHLQHQVKTLFISGLLPKISILVESFREQNRKVSFPDLVQHASSSFDALRSQQAKAMEPRTTPRLKTPARPRNLLIKSTSYSERERYGKTRYGKDQVNLINQDSRGTYVPSSSMRASYQTGGSP